MHVWQNACTNTVRQAMGAKSIFLFLKFYNFIKGVMHVHRIFKKPKISVHTLLNNFLKYL